MRKKLLVTVLLAVCAASVHADAQRKPVDLPLAACRQPMQSKCWLPLAAMLEDEPAIPLEDRASMYLALSMLARRTADFDDAHRFLARAEQAFQVLTSSVSEGKVESDEFFSAHFKYLAAQIQLAQGANAAALTNLELATAQLRDFSTHIQLSKAAALAGLARNREAEIVLRSLQSGLRFKGGPGFCATGILPGLDELNPFETGRRIAAFYLHIGKGREALALLQTMELMRTQYLTNGKDLFQTWADKADATGLLRDQAIVLTAMGELSAAQAINDKLPRLVDRDDEATEPDAIGMALPFLH
jgi:hypothetical protein